MSDLTLRAALRQAQRQIEAIDARVLLCHVTGRDAPYLIAHDDAALTPAKQAAYSSLVQRRAAGEPVAYLVGEREFYGRAFKVTPAVLIPRPETELLVSLALERLPGARPARVLELGTGSGCIAVTLESECSHAEITACDQSLAALEVAATNAWAWACRRLRLVHSDWYSALGNARFEMIVSNPPYVAESAPHLTQGDLRFEPRGALAAGADGMTSIRCIITGAAAHLEPAGWLLLEHGYDQADAVRSLLQASGYQQVFSAADLAGIERVSGGRLTVQSGGR